MAQPLLLLCSLAGLIAIMVGVVVRSLLV